MNRPNRFLSSRPLAFRSRPGGYLSRRAGFAVAAGALLASSTLPAADLVVQGANSPYPFTAGTASYTNIYVGQTANGTLNQSGGTLTANGSGGDFYLGYNAGVTGTYNLSAGTLNSAGAAVGYNGTGVFNQTGGVFNDSGGVYLGYNGGSTGTLMLSGGTLTETAGVSVGYSGTGTLSVSAGTLDNSVSTYAFSVGVLAGSQGTLNLSGTGAIKALAFYVGDSGTGVVNQTGGTGTYNTLKLGYSTGSVGTYNQSAGTVNGDSQSAIEVGYGAGAQGTYNLSGTGLVNAATHGLIVGTSGTGVFNQTGGTVATGNLYILLGSNSGSSGTYTLGGGVLQGRGAQGGSGTSTFHFAGGTLQATGNSDGFLQNLTTADVRGNGGAIIDTQSFAATVAQSLVHDTSTSATDGGLTKQGTGTLTLTGTNTYTGTTTVSAGTLALGTGGSVTGSTVNVSPGGTLTVAGGSVNTGGGTTFLTLGPTTGAATATANLSSGTLATSFLDVGDANGSTGVFNQTGGAATYLNLEIAQVAGSVGTYNQSAGTVTLIRAGSVGVGAAAGGTGTYNLSGTGQLNVQGSGINVGYSGTGVFNQTGGTVTEGVFSLLLGRESGSSGTYTLGGGVLQGDGAVGGSGTSTFHFAGGTLQSTGSDGEFFQGLTTTDVRGNGGAVIDTQNFADTIAQNLVHDTSTSATDGGLTKLGTGTLTLTGTNTYTGATTVSAGTLLANNSTGSATGTGAVTVQSGGTLGGTGAVAGAVTVQNGGRLDAGNPGAAGMLSLGSGLSLNNGATLGVELGGTTPGTGYDQIRVAGTLTLGGTLSVSEINGFKLSLGQTFVLLDDTGTSLVTTTFANVPAGGLYTDAAGNTFRVNYGAVADGDLVPNDVTLTVQSVVPEPSTYALLTPGALGLGIALLRRRRSAALPG